MPDKILIVTEYFYPRDRPDSYYLTEISKTIIENHKNVEVICNSELNDKEELEFVKNKIYRIKENKLDKNKNLQRIIKFIVVTLKLAFFSFFKIKSNTEVFTVTNPAFLPVAFAIFKKFKKFKYTLLVYDVFPENLVAAGYIKESNYLYRFTKKIFDWAYSKCDTLIVIGRDMEDLMRKKTSGKVKLELITNWCDIERVQAMPKNENKIIREYELQDKIVFSFTGNLGKAQGIKKLLEAMNLTKSDKAVLLLIGNGSMLDYVQDFIKNSDRENVIYAGSFPPSEQNVFLNACDISIVSLAEGMLGLGVPSKSYYNMAASNPILYIGDANSEIAKVIKENEIGWISNSTVEDISKCIDEICLEDNIFEKGRKAKEVVNNNYSKNVVLNKYKNLFKSNES